MFSMQCLTGRLIQLCAADPLGLPEAREGARQLQAILEQRAGEQRLMVVAGDFRGLRDMTEEVKQLIVTAMRQDNARLERSAFLISPSAQVDSEWDRLVRLGNNPNRRTFMHLPDLLVFLDEILNPGERAQLRAFLR